MPPRRFRQWAISSACTYEEEELSKQLTEEQKTDLAARKQDQIKYVEWLNGVLAGRTIERIEMGETAGWLLFHLGQEQHDGETFNVFITAYCGGQARNGDEHHYATVALHYENAKQGGGTVLNLRDVRDPDQPAASVHGSDLCRFD